MAAPAIRRSLSACASAASSTLAPRPTLMKYAVGFIAEIAARSTRCRVSAVSGAESTTTSQRGSMRGRSAGPYHSAGSVPSGSPVPGKPYPGSARVPGSRLQASTVIPNADVAMRASSRPMLP